MSLRALPTAPAQAGAIVGAVLRLQGGTTDDRDPRGRYDPHRYTRRFVEMNSVQLMIIVMFALGIALGPLVKSLLDWFDRQQGRQ